MDWSESQGEEVDVQDGPPDDQVPAPHAQEENQPEPVPERDRAKASIRPEPVTAAVVSQID